MVVITVVEKGEWLDGGANPRIFENLNFVMLLLAAYLFAMKHPSNVHFRLDVGRAWRHYMYGEGRWPIVATACGAFGYASSWEL